MPIEVAKAKPAVTPESNPRDPAYSILMPLLDMLRLPSEKIRLKKLVELISYDGSIRSAMPPPGEFSSLRKAPDRNRALRGHGSRPRESTLERFTLDIDGAMDQIVATVDSVFGAKKIAAPATS